MATFQEVQDALTAKLGEVSTQIAAVETQVEALFALVGQGGATPEQLTELVTQIQSGLESLRAGVEQIGIDDPSV